MNNILRHLTHHYCISTKIPPFPALWFTHYDDYHSWTCLDSQDPPKRGKTMPVGIFTDYFSMYLEISDSVGSSDLLKFFSHRPQRCPWPWRFLRRGCPDSAFPRCARKGQVPPWWCCWTLSERGTCHTDVGRKWDPQAGIGGFLEPGVPPGCFWPHLRMCLDCKHGIISMWPLCIQPCEG